MAGSWRTAALTSYYGNWEVAQSLNKYAKTRLGNLNQVNQH
jgi:hypothetical protein